MPKDPIPLRHLGKKEVLTKIPTQVPPVAAGQDHGAWRYGVGVYGAAQGYRRDMATPLLMADMYGFTCEEEMVDAKEYLHRHGGYQLEQVRVLS